GVDDRLRPGAVGVAAPVGVRARVVDAQADAVDVQLESAVGDAGPVIIQVRRVADGVRRGPDRAASAAGLSARAGQAGVPQDDEGGEAQGKEVLHGSPSTPPRRGEPGACATLAHPPAKASHGARPTSAAQPRKSPRACSWSTWSGAELP